MLNVDSDLLDNSNVLLTLEQLVNHGIISSKLHAGTRTYKLSTITCDMFHQNPKQNQQDKCELSRQDNNNKGNPSNNSDTLVHLSDIKGNINSIKTSIEDTLARTFIFFKSELQEKELVEQNLRDDIRNLICEISFFKNIIRHNCSNINS